MFQVDYALMGDARESVRVFKSKRQAEAFAEAVFMDGGVGRVVWVVR